MHTIKLLIFSGFVLTERAYYSAVYMHHDLLVRSPFLHFLIKKPLILSNFLNFLTFLSRGTLILNRCNTDRLSLPTQKHSKSKLGVLIERAPYYTIFVGGVRTIRECALTEVVRYVCLDY